VQVAVLGAGAGPDQGGELVERHPRARLVVGADVPGFAGASSHARDWFTRYPAT